MRADIKPNGIKNGKFIQINPMKAVRADGEGSVASGRRVCCARIRVNRIGWVRWIDRVLLAKESPQGF